MNRIGGHGPQAEIVLVMTGTLVKSCDHGSELLVPMKC